VVLPEIARDVLVCWRSRCFCLSMSRADGHDTASCPRRRICPTGGNWSCCPRWRHANSPPRRCSTPAVSFVARPSGPTHGSGRSIHRRDRITVDLRGLRARLETRAAQHQITTAALVRRAVALMLDDGSAHGGEMDCVRQASSREVAKVTLRMSATHAAMLARRAHAADVARGQYICTLLDGAPAPLLPADHSVAVAALRTSTDQVAAMSVDLNAFLRLLGRVPTEQLSKYRGGLEALADDMRVHLAKASTLIADLAPSRRPRQ